MKMTEALAQLRDYYPDRTISVGCQLSFANHYSPASQPSVSFEAFVHPNRNETKCLHWRADTLEELVAAAGRHPQSTMPNRADAATADLTDTSVDLSGDPSDDVYVPTNPTVRLS